MPKGRLIALGFLSLTLVAGAADRVSLWIWDWRVHRFFAALETEAQLSADQRHALWSQGKWYPLSISPSPTTGPGSEYPTPFTAITFDRPAGIRPSLIEIDGMGGVHLRFLPPTLAWSVALRAALRASQDRPTWIRRFEDSYSIDIQWYGEGPKSARPTHPLVRLYHGIPGAL